MKNYASRKFIHLKPIKELSMNGNEYNDYKSLFVKDTPIGGIRMKNMPDFRLIEVNNLGIVEYYLERLDEAVNLSIQQNGEEHILTVVLKDLKNRLESEAEFFYED
ncbi:TPA: hypothetical protein IWN98_001231 [Enterococcus faecium]|uniref:Uncharacterized protein n=3 Tax=Enterococcus TaxID=1350 RepID=G9M862_ENTFC|nr:MULTISPECIES: hypothetical protein [Enterococcus]APB62462.1 hypothetical protein pEMA120_p51 [Enterococcus faecium]EOF89247.1 hypothetical protein SKG_02703 [Enterococcus faecium EnGen0166]EOH41971.1 hypothetical protein SSI_03027 [Enterococcus faecium EnGen0191]EOM17958.1 hypothetical protein SSM_03071 [Enterococcus faecium EnGen0192]MBG0355253.1 hypothetical protein [Enterococcus faecium]